MNNKSWKNLLRKLEQEPSCYVLITCGEPSDTGEMQVEMDYKGDPSLALLLLQNAQSCVEQDEETSEVCSAFYE